MSNLFILHEHFTQGFTHNLLTLVSVLAIICGILVIISKNPIVSVLFLIGLFLTIALYLMILGISFVGLSYLLVYVGAVSILFLFILMLINVRVSELSTNNNNSIPLSIITIAVFNIVFYDKLFSSSINSYNLPYTSITLEDKYELLNNTKGESLIKPLITNLLSVREVKSDNSDIYFASSYLWDGALAETSHITSIGNILYTSYPMLLLVTSIILLLAMIGAIVITIKQ